MINEFLNVRLLLLKCSFSTVFLFNCVRDFFVRCGNKSNTCDKNIWWNINGKGSFSFGS